MKFISLLDFEKPKVMGILNVSPDSFFDGGQYVELPKALSRVEKMREDGMDILDIGAMSTRPGAEMISTEIEWMRLGKILTLLNKTFPDLPISIDTFRAEIAERSFDCGACMINDISGGQFDSKMFETVGKLSMVYVLMHTPTTPDIMQSQACYNDIGLDVMYYFSQQIEKAKQAGICHIILDPGFGFGKTLAHNYQLLAKLELFSAFKLPLLAGISRKSMLYKLLECTPQEALNGSTCLHTLALLKGANILRVHDVKEAVECIRITNYYQKFV